jgi:hypothetical protein
LPPPDAVIVTAVDARTTEVATTKSAVLDPAGTVAVGGTFEYFEEL